MNFFKECIRAMQLEDAFCWGILVGWITFWLAKKTPGWLDKFFAYQDKKLGQALWRDLKTLNEKLKRLRSS